MDGKLFVGTWRLLSFEFRKENGDVFYPYGQDVNGYLIYTQEGYMSVSLSKKERSKFTTEDLVRINVVEKAAALDTYSSYGGKYKVCRDEKKVIHYIDVSLIPNLIGTAQERYYQFKGNKLILTTPPLLVEGIKQTGVLVWQQVCNES